MFGSSAIAILKSHVFHLNRFIKMPGWTFDVKQQSHCHLQLNAVDVETQNLARDVSRLSHCRRKVSWTDKLAR